MAIERVFLIGRAAVDTRQFRALRAIDLVTGWLSRALRKHPELDHSVFGVVGVDLVV